MLVRNKESTDTTFNAFQLLNGEVIAFDGNNRKLRIPIDDVEIYMNVLENWIDMKQAIDIGILNTREELREIEPTVRI